MRILGVPVRPRASYLLLGAAAAFGSGEPLRADLPDLSPAVIALLAVAIGLALLLSVFLHEVAHALVARRLGLGVNRIELTFWGGQTEIDEPRSAREQYLVSVSGPVVNVLLATVAAIATAHLADVRVAVDVLQPVYLVNLLLAVYNLLPGLPLDGGQLVRAGVWGATGDKVRGLRAAGWGGVLTAAFTVLLGALLVASSPVAGLTTVFVGFLVGWQAQGALLGATAARQLPSLVAGRLARPAFLAVADLPLAEALRRAAERGVTAVVLGPDGRPSAVLSDVLLAHVPEAQRPWVSLSSVTEPVAASLDASLTGEDLLAAMRANPAAAYVVTGDGQTLGVLAAADVALSLRGKRR